MDLGFGGRHVVVTGGTGALGTAVCGLLLEAGALVHVPVFEPKELARFAHRSHDRVRVVEGVDLRDATSVERFYSHFGASPGHERLWASIHIAGGFAMGAISEFDAKAARDMMEMNAMTCYLCCREAVRAMRKTEAARNPAEAASRDGGRIVNVAARPGIAWDQGANMVAYAASKAAVAAMTTALAVEVAPHDIWVNAVAPSIMDTRANRKAMPDADHAAWPKVDEVAATIAFLASAANRATRGGVVPVYGSM